MLSLSRVLRARNQITNQLKRQHRLPALISSQQVRNYTKLPVNNAEKVSTNFL
jgi:hypothetical protein